MPILIRVSKIETPEKNLTFSPNKFSCPNMLINRTVKGREGKNAVSDDDSWWGNDRKDQRSYWKVTKISFFQLGADNAGVYDLWKFIPCAYHLCTFLYVLTQTITQTCSLWRWSRQKHESRRPTLGECWGGMMSFELERYVPKFLEQSLKRMEGRCAGS